MAIPVPGGVGQRLRSRACWAVAFSLLCCGLAHAEDPSAQLRVSRGPYHVGIPMEVQVHINGFEREPDPTCEVDPPRGGSLRFLGLTPNVSTQISIINGRTTRSETVTFICQYQFTPRTEGQHRFQPFRAQQDQKVAQTTAYSIEAEALQPDPKLRLRLRLPDKPIFVGQQVPVEIEWWVDERLQQSIQSYEIRSELFDDADTFRFLPDPRTSGSQQTLNVQTSQEELPLPARARETTEGGNRYVVITSERTLVPLRAGRFSLEGATVNANEVTSWRRDLFGGRRPAATRPIFAQDSPRTLIVKPPPAKGRPASFGGAIGQGFSFGVETDRSVVQVGDPIVLTFTVSGSGELSPVGLPPLNSLLPEDQFRLPEDEISGQVMTGTKAFRVPVRVTDDRVTEIPALPYSWFDPELAEYQTTYSLPIALSVRPAQIVSAEDVVSARNNPIPDPDRNAPGTPPRAELPSYGTRAFGSSEADLAIEIDRKTLTQGPEFSNTGRSVLYGVSVLLLLAAWFVSRRRDASPERAKQRANEKALRQRIEKARNLPPNEALTEIVAALRELAAGRPEAAGPEVEEFIAACDDILYAPGDTSPDVVVRENVHRALELADLIIDRRNGGSL